MSVSAVLFILDWVDGTHEQGDESCRCALRCKIQKPKVIESKVTYETFPLSYLCDVCHLILSLDINLYCSFKS